MNSHSFHPQFVIRNLRLLVFFSLFMILCSCEGRTRPTLIGQPDGPYRLTLSLSPAQPQAGQQTHLTYRVTDSRTGQPVQDLQILHERILHTFIVSGDFRTFAHTHHEDFFPLTDNDLSAAIFHYPYTFSHPGEYFLVPRIFELAQEQYEKATQHLLPRQKDALLLKENEVRWSVRLTMPTATENP